MALNFPDNPTLNDVYIDSASGFSYKWNGTVWISFSPSSSSQIQVIDDISGSFNGSTQTFALTSSGSSITPASAQSLIINLGGIVQDPTDDYSVSGSNITFSTAPSSGLTFSGVSLGPAIPINTLPDGSVSTAKLSDGSVTPAKLSSNGPDWDTSGNLIIAGVTTSLGGFVGNLTGTSTIATYATTAGIATVSQNLTGSPNISVSSINNTGITTSIDFRLSSIAEKTTVINGNTVNLVYNTGGGNVAICTNPTGNITLNITGIPTDSNFNNNSLSFSVIVQNTGTARSCTAVNLNGVSETILWFGGSLSSAISGVTTTTGYDIYSFVGINTIGSAATTSNYIVLGNVNGGYR
jgi:hypothetical protein